jgi:hypothetical protein
LMVWKTPFWSHFNLKTHLPRQARDKHRNFS